MGSSISTISTSNTLHDSLTQLERLWANERVKYSIKTPINSDNSLVQIVLNQLISQLNDLQSLQVFIKHPFVQNQSKHESFSQDAVTKNLLYFYCLNFNLLREKIEEICIPLILEKCKYFYRKIEFTKEAYFGYTGCRAYLHENIKTKPGESPLIWDIIAKYYPSQRSCRCGHYVGLSGFCIEATYEFINDKWVKIYPSINQ